MRPKKVILCVDADEQDLSLRQFLLETHGFRVVTATSFDEAAGILEAADYGTLDLLVAALPARMSEQLVLRSKERLPWLPTLVMGLAVPPRDTAADGFLLKEAEKPAVLLERVRVMTARKRGPREKPQVPQFVAVRAA